MIIWPGGSRRRARTQDDRFILVISHRSFQVFQCTQLYSYGLFLLSIIHNTIKCTSYAVRNHAVTVTPIRRQVYLDTHNGNRELELLYDGKFILSLSHYGSFGISRHRAPVACCGLLNPSANQANEARVTVQPPFSL